jgi:nucleoside-diphosphate-sugar epimerase
MSQKVLLTGATGFLGSRIAQQLLGRTQMSVIGTSKMKALKEPKLRKELANGTERLKVIECDLIKDPECFARIVVDEKPQFVIHTACPLIEPWSESADREAWSYIEASGLLARSSCITNVVKFVMTGSASTAVGQKPTLKVYNDSMMWSTEPTKANERAKFFAEKACWEEILQAQANKSSITMTSLLPYFISGPPMFREQFNNSCSLLDSLL